MDIGDFSAGGAGGGLIAAIYYIFNKYMESKKDDAMDIKLGIMAQSIAKNKDELDQFQLLVARNHPSKTDLKESVDNIKDTLVMISNQVASVDRKLDFKADK